MLVTLIALFALLVVVRGLTLWATRRRFGWGVARVRRLGLLWWQWASDARLRDRMHRIGWHLVPRITGGMASEGIPGYLRYRVVNTQNPPPLWSDGFESLGPNVTLWHSLGTEAGTDNSINYWKQQVGAWSFASNLVTSPATAGNLLYSGHKDWTDVIYFLRFKWTTGTAPLVIVHCDGTVSNYINGTMSSGGVSLQKTVGGVLTNISTTAFSPVNGTFYWLAVVCSGTQYSVAFYNDSAGARGSQIGSVAAQTISDAGVQSGYVGIGTAPGTTASTTHGGAFANVCFVQDQNAIGPFPWTLVTTTGEPAFALSKVAPQAGTYSGSIEFVNSASGNASMQFTTSIPTQPSLTQVQLSGYMKLSAGTANVTAGVLTTPNGTTDSAWHQQIATGNIAANPTVACNYSGAAGRAYFDTIALTSQGGELTNDLPHLHQSTWTVVGMQPGIPSNATVGAFTIPLYPPGTEQFSAAWPTIYGKLSRWLRVEAYMGYSANDIGLGNLAFAGFITQITISYGPDAKAELRGVCDVGRANKSFPFPGEFISNDVTSNILKSFLGTNEVGTADAFNPYANGNYTSLAVPGFTAGSWTADTDDGLNVVKCSTGTSAALVSKSGSVANDRWHTQYVEVTGRLAPSTDAANAGAIGVGLSFRSSDLNDCVYGFIQASYNGGQYALACGIVALAGGVVTSSPNPTNVLLSTNDPQSMIPVTIGLLLTTGGSSTAIAAASLIVNGKLAASYWAIPEDPTNTSPLYPFLFFAQPASGSATGYLTNLLQMTRFSADGPSAASAFAAGSISAAPNSLRWAADPGPTFLDVWTRLATREGWYWRYTPQIYAVGTRTLGSVDYAVDPGTDRSKQVIFARRAGNLVSLTLDDNADPVSGSTVTVGLSTNDGQGLAITRDIATLQTIGVVEDITMAGTNSDYNSLLHAGRRIQANRIATGASGYKQAIVRRDDTTADKFRELDRITIDDPEIGIVSQTARVIARTFTEGEDTETLTLDQFSWHGAELAS